MKTMKTKNEKVFGKSQIKAIAKKYGFWVEFSDMYETYPSTMYGRIDNKEDDAYFSGGPKREEISGSSPDEQEAYFKKYSLSCGEEDRFESIKHTDDYFKFHRNCFWEAYPEFKNHIPVDDYGNERKKRKADTKAVLEALEIKSENEILENRISKEKVVCPPKAAALVRYIRESTDSDRIQIANGMVYSEFRDVFEILLRNEKK